MKFGAFKNNTTRSTRHLSKDLALEEVIRRSSNYPSCAGLRQSEFFIRFRCLGWRGWHVITSLDLKSPAVKSIPQTQQLFASGFILTCGKDYLCIYDTALELLRKGFTWCLISLIYLNDISLIYQRVFFQQK